MNNNTGVMRVLATSGADPLLAMEDNTTSLLLAAGGGAATEHNDVNPNNYRIYTEAAERRALEAFKLAVELGADVNAANEVGQTALHAAAYSGLNTIIQFLVDRGAKMDVMDKWGQTPLSITSNILTVGLADAFNAKPRAMREITANLLLELGATPLGASGVQVDQALLK